MNKKDTKKAVINGGKSSGRALKLLCELHETFIQVCELHEKQIAELEQKLEQTEKDLADYQFNYPKIKELEQENNNLLDVINNQDVKIADLEWQLQEVAKDNDYYQAENKRLEEQLEQAKEIIKEWLRWANDDVESSGFQEIVNKAEQFLREIDITNAIQKANEGLDLDKIADEVEQDIKEQKVK